MCTRAMYVGSDGLVITGRSMDWNEDQGENAWVFPRGMARGGPGPQSLKWVSQYGSLGLSAYEAGISEGINEKGLVLNGLYLVESDYGPPDDRPTISIMAFGQYVLDLFGSVAEAVTALRGESVRIVGFELPNGKPTTIHMSLSDPSGDSGIFEWLEGKLVIHHGPQYRVLTNSPTYDQQLAIREYWSGIDPMTFLPGSITAPDRFVRASFLIDAIPQQPDKRYIAGVPGGAYEHQAVAAVMSVMRTISTPLGITHPTKPNVSSTLWRTVMDQKNLVMYYDSATRPNAFWVPLADLDFAEGAPVKKLTIAGGKFYAGNAAGYFEPAEPLKFASMEAR
jgi:penicillin V acylase-like amidase (Ntn superfamily)